VHLGRLDHQVKIRGFRIELGEIEAALSRHQAVRQAVVLARDDQQGVKQLVAYVVCQDGPVPNQQELRSFLQSEIPEYMVPSLFVFLKAMPLTANNKIDRKALPAPDSTLASSAVYVAPRDRMDIQMAVLWQQVFEIDKVGIHDNFFDLGGHSLRAARLFHLIEQIYGRHLPLSTLFQAPTIAGLTSVLAQEQWTPPWQSLVAMQPNGSVIPIFLVPGVMGNVLWLAQLARLLGQTHPVYGLQARGLDGDTAPFGSVPEMAQQYIAEIRTCVPQGPYVIVGACTGGLVAYEMAQQLAEQERAVILGIINSWHPSSYHQHYDTVRPSRLALPLGILLQTLRTVRELRRMPMSEWWSVIQRKCKSFLSVFQGPTGNELRQRQIKRVRQAMFRAAARYTMRPYPGHILNIVASQRIESNDTRYAWRELAGAGCRTIEMSALRTADLLVSPHVEDVSSHIRRYIVECSQDTPVRPNSRAA